MFLVTSWRGPTIGRALRSLVVPVPRALQAVPSTRVVSLVRKGPTLCKRKSLLRAMLVAASAMAMFFRTPFLNLMRSRWVSRPPPHSDPEPDVELEPDGGPGFFDPGAESEGEGAADAGNICPDEEQNPDGYGAFADRGKWHQAMALRRLRHVGHDLVSVGSGHQCTKCLNTFARSTVVARSKDTEPCSDLVVRLSSPLTTPQRRVEQGPLCLGGFVFHPGHTLRQYRGAIFCTTCGLISTAGAPLRGLAGPCVAGPGHRKDWDLKARKLMALKAPTSTYRWTQGDTFGIKGFV